MKKFAVAFGGESLIKEYDLYGYRRGVREIVCTHLRWGKPFRNLGLYGYRRGVHEKVCYHLRWGKPFRNLGLYGYRRGGTFDSPKGPKRDLG